MSELSKGVLDFLSHPLLEKLAALDFLLVFSNFVISQRVDRLMLLLDHLEQLLLSVGVLF